MLESLPESERAATIKDLDLSEVHVERTLDVRWNMQSDKFGYKIMITDRPATRQGILSLISSVNDPLGFVSPFLLVRGVITYLRLVNERGEVHCCFLIGKSRLAPLKATTIPQLELSAAVAVTR